MADIIDISLLEKTTELSGKSALVLTENGTPLLGDLTQVVEDIAALEEDLTAAESGLVDVIAESADNASKIAVLEADNTTNKSDISTLKSDNTTNKSDISALKSDNTVNKSDISDLKALTTTHSSDISDIETNQLAQDSVISSLESDLTNVESDIVSLNSAVGNRVIGKAINTSVFLTTDLIDAEIVNTSVKRIIIDRDLLLTKNWVVPSGVELEFVNSAKITGSFTITGTGTIINAAPSLIFDSGVVIAGTFISKTNIVPVQWFSGIVASSVNISPFINACLSAFGSCFVDGIFTMSSEVSVHRFNSVVFSERSIIYWKSNGGVLFNLIEQPCNLILNKCPFIIDINGVNKAKFIWSDFMSTTNDRLSETFVQYGRYGFKISGVNILGYNWLPITATPNVTNNNFTVSGTYSNYIADLQEIRISSTLTTPAPLSEDTVYYAIKDSATTFRVASSYANAVARTPITITDVGTGTVKVEYGMNRSFYGIDFENSTDGFVYFAEIDNIYMHNPYLGIRIGIQGTGAYNGWMWDDVCIDSPLYLGVQLGNYNNPSRATRHQFSNFVMQNTGKFTSIILNSGGHTIDGVFFDCAYAKALVVEDSECRIRFTLSGSVTEPLFYQNNGINNTFDNIHVGKEHVYYYYVSGLPTAVGRIGENSGNFSIDVLSSYLYFRFSGIGKYRMTSSSFAPATTLGCDLGNGTYTWKSLAAGFVAMPPTASRPSGILTNSLWTKTDGHLYFYNGTTDTMVI